VKPLTVGIARLLAPGYGTCWNCGWPWKYVKPHSTMYNNGHGCFPLCEQCWERMTVEQRLPAYRWLVFDLWGEPDLWPAVETAVRSGK